ncbi:MAG: signal recognition particle-docking protein FtsY [Acidimicrobiales bacterium]
MTLVVVVVLLAVFVMVVGGAVLVRSRRYPELEPPDIEAAAEPLLAADHDRLPPPVVTPEEAAAVEAEALGLPEPPPAPGRPRIRDRLGKARGLITGYVGSVLSRSSIDDSSWDDIEEALIRADVGVATTGTLIDNLRQRVKSDSLDTPEQLLSARRDQLKADLAVEDRRLHLAETGTNVWLFVGVNGVGKTTTIGKLGLRRAAEGNRVVMAAGDTFRAAAAEQLQTWAERVGADLVRGAEGGDPGAVVFDAVQRAAARGADLVLADTAGRLHTKVNLMEELRKVHRVAQREPGVVSEVLLVIDATTGQNGLTQAREFAEAVGVTGVVLTKLDGTAKGGIVLAIQAELGIPVKLVGVGEGPEDLIDFDPDEFVDALFAA